MSRREKIDNQSIDKTLGLFGALSRQELKAAEERASRRFGNVTARTSSVNARFVAVEPAREIAALRGRRWRLAMVAASAAVFLAVVIGGIVRWQAGSFAVVESADGSLYRIVNGKTQRILVGERLDAGQTLRTNGGASAVFKIADGSLVELRSKSELSLELAEDGGPRIHLNQGGIIVKAAKQQKGRRLYVKTKDVNVSVIGTVFLVNAEEEGSRVAVIEGEVQVQQGNVAQTLLPGEQVVTNSAMARLAPPTLALLHQSASLVGAPADVFEEVSVRPSPPPSQGTRGGGGGGANARGNRQPCIVRQRVELDPRRLLVTRATLHGLIAKAYGVDCNLPGGIGGEPEWGSQDQYDIEALIPARSPAYAAAAFLEGKAPELNRMLQRLLADRFKLKLRRELKELPAYNMIVTKAATWECHLPQSCHGMRLSEDQSPEAIPVDREGMTAIATTLNLHEQISKWVSVVTLNTGRPVIDKTGLRGYYDIRLEYPDVGPPPTSVEDVERLRTQRKDRFISTIQEQLGFKLEPTTALVEVLVIEHVDKPSQN
jgi:uncharacterized protein (TIGR03435 family)